MKENMAFGLQNMLWLNSFKMMLSSSSHLPANDKILFFVDK
jgi:hypothetical protein